jgi:glutathione-independent formaldehyde dehydrogenase
MRATGGIGVAGMSLARDPGSPDESGRKGHIALDMGQLRLREVVSAGKAKPSQIISHVLPLDKAPEGYRNLTNARTAVHQGPAEAGRGGGAAGRRSNRGCSVRRH